MFNNLANFCSENATRIIIFKNYFMKNLFLLFFIAFLTSNLFAQKESPRKQSPEFNLEKSEVESHLRFLASDEMQGRRTGTVFNNIAARYIAEKLREYGVQPAVNESGYLQKMPFVKKTPPKEASFTLDESNYKMGENLIMISGDAANVETKAVFVGNGWIDEESGHNDYENIDIKGKIAVVLSGVPNGDGPYSAFEAMPKKREIAASQGAAGLIEIYQIKFPWAYFKRFMNRERLTIEKDDVSAEALALPYGWINEGSKELLAKLNKSKKGLNAKIQTSGVTTVPSPSYNVAGIIPGSDPELREEFIILTAHFDHVGTGRDGGGRYTEQDSIFNGTRDNGMGTVALISAAKALAKAPPKRSVIILAVTGEEIGLLGSAYYADNPLVPLEKTVYNLNTDGAGYDDVSAVSITGYGRTGTDSQVDLAAKAFDLKIIPNPAPEQNLYDRSDNVSFAAKGIPAICFSPGTTGFSEEIQKYYHQVSDNPDSIDYDYLLKFCQSFAYTARLIGDMDSKPMWAEGDKYEEAGIELYKKP